MLVRHIGAWTHPPRAGRLNPVCSLDIFWRLDTPCSCRVWHLLMFETLFGQISGTSPPKAVFEVVAGRFYRVYVRSIYFDACLDTAFGCDVCEIWQKALRTLAKSHTLHEHCVFNRQNVSNEHTSPKKRPATTLDTASGCDVCEIWQKALRTLAKAPRGTSIVFPSAKIYRTNIEAIKKRSATTLDTAFGCDV